MVLRPWDEADIPALVAGCNDPLIAHWIPTITLPDGEDDALAFIRGEVRSDDEAMAIELDGRVVGGIGLGVNAHGYRASIGYWIAEPHAARAFALVPCGS